MEYLYSSSSSAAPPTTSAPPPEIERMFEKVVTPSDVGKLNRLVIPKQHAEKYFPLDSAAGEKGLLLNFQESRTSGKSWRFRYSYWSSSQSYVITKGWSRFVKDKKLDAGDVVSFSRTFSGQESVNATLYIDWTRRRRPEPPIPWYYNYPHPFGVRPFHQFPLQNHSLDLGQRYATYNYGVISQNSCLHHGSVVSFEASRVGHSNMLSEQVTSLNEKVGPKRLRLFGVNMEEIDQPNPIPNPIPIPIPIPSSSLQLRLCGDPSSGGAAASAVMGHLDKGKASMSLDFEV